MLNKSFQQRNGIRTYMFSCTVTHFNSIRIHLEDQWIEINLMFIFGLQWPIRHAIVEDWDLMVCNYCIFGL